MKLSTFTKDYTEQLRKAAKAGNVSAYHVESFDYDPEAVFETFVELPDDLEDKMLQYADAAHDLEAAKVLFEAMPDLSREQACYAPFWAYLSHVVLYRYMVKRFCEDKQPELKDIRNHWWHTNLMRRGLSNLWWSVRQSVVETPKGSAITYDYSYTDYYFKRIDFRQRRMGSSTLYRHPAALRGILQFLKEKIDDASNGEYFEGRANYCMMYFNKVAVVKQLAALDQEYFYNTLCNIEQEVMAITHREQVAGALEGDDWESE